MALPYLSIRNRQRGQRVHLKSLLNYAQQALPEVDILVPGPLEDAWKELENIEVSLVSDRAIAKVHGEFLNDPTPTDVITFHHGEILVSAETAAREAVARKLPLEQELLLYIIHGMLHLRGHDDHEAGARRTMHRIQKQIHKFVRDRHSGR